jgi:hypothetical protein
MTFLQVIGYAGAALGLLFVLWLIDALFLGIANRFRNPNDEYPHRVATELPRLPRE